MKYDLQIRSQHAKGRGSNHGPDTYVAVTITPDGVEVPKYLDAKVLAKRGITLKYFGEGYSRSTGPKSMLANCIARAKVFIAQQQERG